MMEIFRFKEEVQTAYERLQHPIGIFQDVDGQIVPIVLSDGFCEMFGYENQARAYYAISKDPFTDIHPNDLIRIKNEAYRFLKMGGKYDVVYRTREKEGTESKVIRVSAKHVYMGDTRFTHIWFTDESIDVNKMIIDLQESVSSLLANMPAMTFSKDVVTRKYLACNQAFADYAHKETPEGVVGLTDFEIFDAKTAEHFIEDDKKALAMDKPYIFYEDVPDAAGNPRRFQTTKLKFVDATGRECLLGLCQDVTDAMRIKQEYDERLANARTRANIDALTGIRNKYAYLEFEEKINEKIAGKRQAPFAITLFDVNDLKTVNDTKGHQAGDEYICGACMIICKRFKHSPVFRIGGDEFVAISEGEDYENLEELLKYFEEYNEEAKRTGGIVIACGSSKYDGEDTVAPVFQQADKNMYENKRRLKEI